MTFKEYFLRENLVGYKVHSVHKDIHGEFPVYSVLSRNTIPDQTPYRITNFDQYDNILDHDQLPYLPSINELNSFEFQHKYMGISKPEYMIIYSLITS